MDVNQIILGSVLLTLAVVLPGLAITLALFPKKDSLSIVERGGLSMVFGFTPSFISYFNAKNLSIPIDEVSSPLTIAFVTLASLGIWLARKNR